MSDPEDKGGPWTEVTPMLIARRVLDEYFLSQVRRVGEVTLAIPVDGRRPVVVLAPDRAQYTQAASTIEAWLSELRGRDETGRDHEDDTGDVGVNAALGRDPDRDAARPH